MDTKAYDKFTSGVRSIDTDHSYIHDGIGFVCSKVLSLTGSATLDCTFVTPGIGAGLPNVFMHMRPISAWSSASAVLIDFYEGATTTGGTLVTGSFNRNRNVPKDSSMILTSGVTTSVTGTLLTSNYVGTAGTPAKVAGGGTVGSFEEIVLKPSTKYLLRIVNQTSTATSVDVSLFWYEEEMG